MHARIIQEADFRQAEVISLHPMRLLQRYVSFGSKRNVAKWIMNKKQCCLICSFLSFCFAHSKRKKRNQRKKNQLRLQKSSTSLWLLEPLPTAIQYKRGNLMACNEITSVISFPRNDVIGLYVIARQRSCRGNLASQNKIEGENTNAQSYYVLERF